MATEGDNELRKRITEPEEKPEQVIPGSEIDSDDDRLPEQSIEQRTKEIPQGTDQEPSFLHTLLSPLPPRWRNWVIRGIFTWLMIGLFCLIIYIGPGSYIYNAAGASLVL